ncbi:MAG: hypothetical protein OEZ30_02535 [Candidatus Aminicenantes bacterium]|nr:hypothetical protein [Candidatus Aminicenantes bacterium]
MTEMIETREERQETSPGLYAGIFLLSSGSLLFEISLTRIFSVSLWYHFAFMVVSIALLGIGASGTFLMLFPRILRGEPRKLLFIISLLFSLACLGSYLIANRVPFDPIKIAWDYRQLLLILLYYGLFSLPFFCSGMCIAAAFSRYTHRVGSVYFADLTGAGTGCLASLVIFYIAKDGQVVTASALLGILAALCFLSNNKKRLALIPLIILLGLLIWLNPEGMRIRISPYKGLTTALKYPDSRLVKTEWNSFSRVDLIESPLIRFAPGLSLSYQEPLPSQVGICTDGDNLSAITRFDGNPAGLRFTSFLPSSLPFYLSQKDEVFIFEPGGGLDILTALHHGAKRIRVAEMNPLVVGMINKYYGEFSGNIYHNKSGIEVVIAEPRSYLRGSEEKFDIILHTTPNLLGAASTGIYGLIEDYRFTREGMVDFYRHLKPEGALCFTLYLLPPPRIELRLVSLFLAALKEVGAAHPQNHIAVLRSWGTITLLLKHNPLGEEDIFRLREFARERRFDLVYYPGITQGEANIYNRFPQPLYYNLVTQIMEPQTREEFYRDYPFNVTPTSDERPFFYHFFRLSKLPQLYQIMGEKWQPFLQGDYLVPIIFLQALAASIIFIALPTLFVAKRGKKKMKETSRWPAFLSLSYFFFIGVGFMFVEISIIQKFILFLGHPAYAIATVLLAILVSSGIGAFLSDRFLPSLKWVIAVLAGLILLYMVILPRVQGALLGWSMPLRQVSAVVVLFPLGVLMGMCLPGGLRLLKQIAQSYIPWAWCVNGCASVMSSVGAIIIASAVGFSWVIGIGGMVYMIGWGCFFAVERGLARKTKLSP